MTTELFVDPSACYFCTEGESNAGLCASCGKPCNKCSAPSSWCLCPTICQHGIEDNGNGADCPECWWFEALFQDECPHPKSMHHDESHISKDSGDEFVWCGLCNKVLVNHIYY